MNAPKIKKTSKSLIPYITHTNLFKSFDKGSTPVLEKALELVHLAELETLFFQGEEGNCLYVLIAGEVGAAVTQPDGTTESLDKLFIGSRSPKKFNFSL